MNWIVSCINQGKPRDADPVPWRPRRPALNTRVLIVCPDSLELAFLTGALSGHFAVLAARDTDEAARLSAHFGPSQLAYLALKADDDPATLLKNLDGLAPRIITLLHGPRSDTANNNRQPHDQEGVCRLPLSPGALLARTWQALGLPQPAKTSCRRSGSVLTPEEIAFLLGRPLADVQTAAAPA
ncbi:MAG TPA: hypothetical protein PKC79_02810 [Solidesulfovibrio magneticus]|nr:hypothetical protein [Solidesulfovibrio magneticus]